jgi:hypothetical protein
MVIQSRYDWKYPFSEGIARIQLNKKYGYVDRNSREYWKD